jgi:uncharacterized SAM-binding protein YcdF (DUF218 family)
VRGASIFWFLFSTSGVLVTFLIAVAWLVARPASRTARWFLGSVAISYALISIYAVPHLIERAIGAGFHQLARADVPPGRTVVVLLGSGNYRREDWSNRRVAILDPIGLERTLEAARVYRLTDAAFIISSGGVIDQDEPIDPAGNTMKDTLVQLGVPSDRIIVEDTSTNTRDEAVQVAAMLPSLQIKHVVLVTSLIHMRRAIGIFRAVGIDAIPAVARGREYSDFTVYFLPTDTGLRMSALAAHELAGLAYYRLKGWYR